MLDEARTRIIDAAAALLTDGGRDAVTTRAVAAAAGVQAPAIYRLFGDKNGLLEAVAEHGFATHLAGKRRREPGPDPVADLRAGITAHVEFGLANPALYTLLYAQPGHRWRAAVAGERVLAALVHRIAVAGRLRVPEPLAVQLVHAAGCGTVLTLLARPEGDRDPGLADAARDAVVAAVTTDAPDPAASPTGAAAVTLRAALPGVTGLTDGERALLGEWLTRIGG